MLLKKMKVYTGIRLCKGHTGVQLHVDTLFSANMQVWASPISTYGLGSEQNSPEWTGLVIGKKFRNSLITECIQRKNYLINSDNTTVYMEENKTDSKQTL